MTKIILHVEVFAVLVVSQIVSMLSIPTTSCGQYVSRQGKIIGGNDTFRGEFPFVVSIKSVSEGHICAGFIIGERTIISAGHCFSKIRNLNLEYTTFGQPLLSSLVVSLGEYNLKAEEDPNAVNATIGQIIMHPEYNDETLDNDIAIVRLENTIVWQSHLQPICLPDTDSYNPSNLIDAKLTVVGWGKTDHCQGDFAWRKKTEKMQKVDIAAILDEDCIKSYTLKYEFKKKDYICAGQPGRDSSQGDSGGPLMQNLENKWFVIGIVSAGPRCGDELPGVYTRVSTHLNWIQTNIL